MSNSNQYVVCVLCNKSLKEITWSHLKSHGINLKQYQEKFPDAPHRSPETHLLKSESAILANQDLQRRQLQSARMSGESNPFFGKCHDDKTKNIISANVKAAWSKNYDRLATIRKETAPVGEAHHNWKGGKISGGKKHKFRMMALAHYGANCMIDGCEFSHSLHAHHIIPRHEGGGHIIENCVILCPNHHALADAGILSRDYLFTLTSSPQ